MCCFQIGGKTELLHYCKENFRVSQYFCPKVHNVQRPPVESFQALLTIASSTKSDQPTDLAQLHRTQIPQSRQEQSRTNHWGKTTINFDTIRNPHIHNIIHIIHVCFLAWSPTWTSLGPRQEAMQELHGRAWLGLHQFETEVPKRKP